MKTQIGNQIYFEDNRSVYILDIATIDDKEYALAVLADGKENTDPSIIFYTEKTDGNEIYLDPVTDIKLMAVLSKKFKVRLEI